MIRFFKIKGQLFGKKKLVKDITLEDFDEDDIACLKTGCIQQAGKDMSNRLIFVQLSGLRAYKTLMNEMRTLFYITMQALCHAEEVQLHGTVCIMNSVDDFRDSKNGEGFFEHARIGMAVPIRLASNHLCYSEIHEYILCNVVFRTFPVELRSRIQLHSGSHVECQYGLSTYGIAQSALPLKPYTHLVNLDRHLQWVQKLFDERQS